MRVLLLGIMAALMASATAKSTPAAHTPPGFAQAVLKGLGTQPTKAKVDFLNWWFANEGNNSGGSNGINNPLNIQGANPVPYNYATMQQGVAATVATIKSYNKPVSQGGLGNIYNVITNPKATGAQIAAAVETSKWASSHYGAYDANGHYVGGHLLSRYLPSAPKSPGFWTVVGEVGHFTAHPGAGVQTDVKAAKAPLNSTEQAIGGAVNTVTKDFLYGLAIAGGGALCIVGLILIGADIGLEKLGKTKPARIGGRAADAFGPAGRKRRATARENEAYSQLEREHRVQRTQIRTRTLQHKESQAKANAKVAKQRIRKPSKAMSNKIPY